MNITPEKITEPFANEIVIVGTNLAGVPGAGFAHFVNRDIEFIKGLTYGCRRRRFFFIRKLKRNYVPISQTKC